jgi:FkbM family methyltransferase
MRRHLSWIACLLPLGWLNAYPRGSMAWINKVLSLFDVKLSRASRANHWWMQSALQRLSQSGIPVQSVIDVGAASGLFSLMSHQCFPDASIMAIEPLSESFQILQRRLSKLPQVDAHQCVVGNVDGASISFTVSDDLDGSGVGLTGGTSRSIACRTLDSLASQYMLRGPFLLKLDTHGYELPILEGGQNVLRHCSAIIVEAYNFKISESACLFWELCAVMDRYGFRPIDIADPSPRSLDDAFWQLDIVFIPVTSPRFLTNAYR